MTGRVGEKDHRNHGTRLVDQQRNLAWSKDPELNPTPHSNSGSTCIPSKVRSNQNRYQTCVVNLKLTQLEAGSAEDVSFLIDHLPSFLYPSGERTIVEWGIGGVSLGGHSTWIALSRGAHELLIHSHNPHTHSQNRASPSESL